MNALPGPAYCFTTPAQLRLLHGAGLAETLRIDPDSGVAVGGIFGCPFTRIAALPNGDLCWVDDGGRLFVTDRAASSAPQGGARVGPTARLIAGKARLWLLGAVADGCASRRLRQFDAATLQLLIDREMAGLTDIAGDGADGLWLLREGRLECMSNGGVICPGPVDPHTVPSRIATAGGALALLSSDGGTLDIFDPQSGRTVSLDLVALAGDAWPGGEVRLDGGGAFLLQGIVTLPDGPPAPGFLLINADGDLLLKGGWRDDRVPALLAVAGTDLLAAFADGDGQRLWRLPGLARYGGQRRMTPALDTESPSGTWLRADIVAKLPEGATLTLRWAATGDEGLRETVERIFDDPARPPSVRFAAVEALLNWSPSFTYAGTRRDPDAAHPVPFETLALPLHEAAGPILWVDLQLRSNGALATGPALESLVVLHEARSLIDDLPAIYRGDGDRDGTMRRLVGVLEATTQGVDRSIGALADRLAPARTPEEWLPDLAAMLGLPFHDALSPEMQRRLVCAAAPILTRRGTRDGLLAMLRALFPGRPIRVVDRTEQLIPLALGGKAGGGGRLPALLAGPSVRVPKLNARLVLKKTALCPTNACTDAMIAPPPQVLVVIPASREERRLYGDGVARMIEAMLPAGVRLRLNWISWNGGASAAPDDVLTVLDGGEPVSLGEGPALGRARTGGRSSARLDSGGVVAAEHRLL